MAIDAATVRKVAKLARIRERRSGWSPWPRSSPASWPGSSSSNEVDTEGVEPMASAVAVALPMREDVVTEGGDPAEVLANAPKPTAELLRRAQGGGMSRS